MGSTDNTRVDQARRQGDPVVLLCDQILEQLRQLPEDVKVEEFWLQSGLAPEVAAPVLGEQRCVFCGCTDEWGCDAGCYWVARDLCSECEPLVDVAAGRIVDTITVRGGVL